MTVKETVEMYNLKITNGSVTVYKDQTILYAGNTNNVPEELENKENRIYYNTVHGLFIKI